MTWNHLQAPLPEPWITENLVCFGTHDHPGREYMRLTHVQVIPLGESTGGPMDFDDRERTYRAPFGDVDAPGYLRGWCLPTGPNFALAFADLERRHAEADARGRERARELRDNRTW